MNIRAAAYDTGRALFAAARELEGRRADLRDRPLEIGYTDQRPAEYVAVMTAAAIREGWSGPLFIQGDHFQVNAKKYAADPEPEVRAVRT
jgi:fructose-bisphosphate aldolase, class II